MILFLRFGLAWLKVRTFLQRRIQCQVKPLVYVWRAVRCKTYKAYNTTQLQQFEILGKIKSERMFAVLFMCTEPWVMSVWVPHAWTWAHPAAFVIVFSRHQFVSFFLVFSLWWGKGHIVATTQNALQFQRSSYCRLSAEQRSHLSEGESGTGGNGMSCVFSEPGVGWGH